MADGDPKVERDPETGDLIFSHEMAVNPPRSDEGDHFENLAQKFMQTDTLDRMSSMITELVSFDEQSRSEWENMNEAAILMMGVGPESDPDGNDPDGYQDTSDHPLLLTAMTRFQSKALSAMLPSDDVMIRTEPAFNLDDIEDPKEREKMQQEAEEAGRRVARFYTEYLQKRVDSYEPDTDQILYESGLMGLGLRKIVKDPTRAHCPVDPIYVPNSDIIISYDAKNFRSGRITHRMDTSTPELIRKLKNGTYRVVTGLQDGESPDKDPIKAARDRIIGLEKAYMDGNETHRIYEVQMELFLDSDPHPDGLARPYIVTIHAASQEVLRVVRNWSPNDPSERPIEHYAAYILHPGKSAVYGLGLGHILANVTRSLRRAQRRGLEAAYLQNHPSGFKLSNLTIRDEATKITSGTFVDVDSPTTDIRAALMLHPFQGPSPGLIQLADRMEANGKELGGIATIDFAQLMKSGVAAGPAMAAYEESTEFQTAIHRRLYTAHRNELTLIHERMREVYGSKPIPFGTNETLREGDLLLVDILPYMKPGQASKQKSILEAQAIWDMAKEMPDVVNKRKAAMELIRALGKPNIDDILMPDPEEEMPEPADPVSEYGMILRGMPVRAGVHQNHEAHISAHRSQMNLLVSSNLPTEQGDAAMAIISAHIAEHMGLQQVVQVAMMIGIEPAMLGPNMPEEMEYQIAPMIAQAIQIIERERAQTLNPQDGERERIARMKEELKTERDLTMQEREQLHEKEIQRMKDEAEWKRAVQDDETAVEIAAMKDRNKAPTRAGGISS